MAFQPLPTFGDLQNTKTLAATNDTVVLEASGASGSIINVSGTWVGKILVEGSNDRFATIQNVTLWSPPVGFISTGITGNGYYRLAAIAGFTQIRARMSEFTSGLAVVVLSTSTGTATVAALSPNASSFKNTSNTNDGSGNSLTSQINGPQRALDVGINVLGEQVDPRAIRNLTLADKVTVVPSVVSSTFPTTPGVGETVNNRAYQTVLEITLNSNGTEQNAILFKNPASSGKKAYISEISFSNTTGASKSVVVRAYTNPTVTVAGTALTPQSMNIGGGAPPASMVVTLSPSTSGPGTKISAAAQTNEQARILYDWGVILNPGNSILITGTPLANNVPMVINIIWSEA